MLSTISLTGRWQKGADDYLEDSVGHELLSVVSASSGYAAGARSTTEEGVGMLSTISLTGRWQKGADDYIEDSVGL
jgi:hypothetical protein